MPIKFEFGDKAASSGHSVNRRGLLRLGTLVTALTGASAVSTMGVSGAQAAPGDVSGSDIYIPAAEKATPFGVATLDANAKIIPAQLPDLSATYGPTAPAMMAAYGQAIAGTPGRRYKLVAGVLRNNGVGSGYWQMIDDADHRNIGVSSLTTSSGRDGTIEIDYSALGGSKVVSFVAAPDETLAKAGFIVGASVTRSMATLSLAQAASAATDFVYYSGSAWVSTNGVFKPTFSAGVLTLTHSANKVPLAAVYDISVQERGGTYVCCLSSESSVLHETQVKIEFRDWAGTLLTTPNTNMKAFVSHGGGTRKVDPQTVDTALYPSSNIWFIGIMEA